MITMESVNLGMPTECEAYNLRKSCECAMRILIAIFPQKPGNLYFYHKLTPETRLEMELVVRHQITAVFTNHE